MVDFGQAIRDYVRFGYCTSLGNIATFGEIFGGGGSGVGEFGINAARFLHNQFCNVPAPPDPPPAFTGGQCVGTQYRINHSVTFERQGQSDLTISGFVDVWGPVGNGQLYNESEAAGVRFSGSTSGTDQTAKMYTGVSSTVAGGFPKAKSYAVASVVVINGGSNNCGNPPPVRPPYTPGGNSNTNNITYTDNSGNNITIPVGIAFGYAKVDANLNLNIPFTLKLNLTPTLNVTGNLNLNTGDVTYNSGNPALPSSDCSPNSDAYKPDPAIPDNPVGIPPEVPDPTPDPNKPQYRKLLKAVIVTVTTPTPRASVIFQDTNPDVYAPDLGLVSFQISVQGRSAWTADIPVKNKRQWITCPWEGGATAVKGTPRPGSVFTLTPIYLAVTADKTFPD